MENRGVSRQYRWLPMWPGVVLAPVWLFLAGVLALPLLEGGWRQALPPLPVFLVFGCGVLVFFNRSRASVTAEGVSVHHGPLPFTLTDARVVPADVSLVYSREVVRGPKSGGNYFAAGVRTRAGRHYDIFAPVADAGEAHRLAMEMGRIVAAATREGLDCVNYGVRPFPEDREPMLRMVGWMLLFVVSLLVGVFLEIVR